MPPTDSVLEADPAAQPPADALAPETGEKDGVAASAPGDGATEVEAEPAKEETPEEKAAREKEERKAARIKAAEEAELEAAESRQEKKWRQERAQYEAQLEAERQQLAYERQQLAQQSQTNQQFVDLIARVRRGEASPDEALQLVGTNYEQLTRDWLSKQTPEGIAKAALAEAQAAKKLLAQREEADQQRAREQAAAESRTHFVSWVDANDDTFPHLAEFDPDEIGVAAERLAQAGVTSYNEIARRLEAQAKALHDVREKRRQVRLARKQPSNGTTPEQTQAPQGNGAPAKQPSPRALPSALATQKVTPQERPQTDDELDADIRRRLREAREIDRRNAEKSA